MADTTIKKWNPTLNNNNGGWEEVYPETTVGQIQASGTRGSTTFLRGDGVWATPIDVDTNNYLTGVSGSGDGTVTFTRSGLSNLTWDASHTHSEYLLTTGKAADSNLLDGLDSVNFKNNTHTSHSANDLASGWYTIATNTGDRAIARFGLKDSDSGRHQSVVFYAAHHFGTNASNTLTVLHQSSYGTTPFRYIRIREGSTYDGAALQVYIDNGQNNVEVFLLGDNFQSSGWVLKDWIPSATDPGDVSNYSTFTTRGEINLDNIVQGGMATTGDIYAGGDTTQYRVLTTNDEGSGNGIDADTVDGKHIWSGNNWDRIPLVYSDGVMEIGRYIDFHNTSGDTSDYAVRLDTNGTTGLRINGNNILTTANEGSGNGIDADTLDGQHGSYYAPKASPALTGTPTAPTAAANTNTTQIATTAYVQQEITDLIGGAPGALDTLNELAEAINDDASYASTITTALAGKVAKSGDTMTGNLTISNSLPKIQLTDTNNDSDFHIANNNGVLEIADTSNQEERFAITSAGNVGIGTTSPTYKLDVNGTARISSTVKMLAGTSYNENLRMSESTNGYSSIAFGANPSTDTGTQAGQWTLVKYPSSSSDKFALRHQSTDIMTLLTDGKVGIGTASPSYKLDVVGNSRIDATSAGATLILGRYSGQPTIKADTDDGGYLIMDSTSNLLGLNWYTNQNVIINNGGGNTGIGTTSPGEKLQVNGNIRLNSTLPKIQFIDTNNDSDFHIANNNGVLEIADTTNQLERFKIDSSGNVTLPASGGLTLVDKALTNSSGAVLWDGDEIYHEGHKPTYAELGTMAYSNLTGTPTIPTNNNQLTNGAGYTTNTGTVTSVATGGGLTGGTITGSGTISHADTSTQASVNNSGNTFIQDITLDTYGHITAITSATASSSGGNTWTEIKTGSTTISSGTTVTNVTLSSAIDDTSVIAFELNTASVTSYTSQVFIVKIENSSSTNGGILYNQYAASTLIRTGSLRVYRGINSTTLSFSNVYYHSNGSSAETADTVYVGKIWKLGVTGA